MVTAKSEKDTLPQNWCSLLIQMFAIKFPVSRQMLFKEQNKWTTERRLNLPTSLVQHTRLVTSFWLLVRGQCFSILLIIYR